MTQGPTYVDQLGIEPGSGDTLLLKRHTVTGALQFFDALITTGITLKELAGLQSVENVLVVGTSGAGAEYNTPQAALDAVPATASVDNPYFILIGPGRYRETINVVRDGVTIIGFGAVLQSAEEAIPDGPGAYHTVVIHEDLGTIPKNVLLWNLPISNVHQNFAAVRIVGGAGSEVGSGGITLLDCGPINRSAIGGRTIWATSANYIRAQGGSFKGSGPASLALIEECAEFSLNGVEDVTGLQMDYDNGGDLPSEAGCLYRLNGCSRIGGDSILAPPVSSELIGDGSLLMQGCTAQNVRLSGDRATEMIGSRIGDLNLQDTVQAALMHTSRGALTAAAGTTLAEAFQSGVASFAAAASVAVTFAAEHPDDDYRVGVELSAQPAGDEQWWLSAKSSTGFTIEFASPQTLDARWSATRRM